MTKEKKNQKEIIEEIRTRVKLEEYGVENSQSTDFPGTYEDYDDAWDFDKFKQNFHIEPKKFDNPYELEFDMIGVDASIANSFRRILLAELPTMAIEKVHIYNNTSIIQDEVLAHRIGLIPLKADSRLFKYKPPTDQSDEGTEEDTLKFELKIKCKKDAHAKKDAKDAYINSKVLTSHMKWIPQGEQASKFTEKDVGPIHDDILIAKMRPGQELELELFAVKGLGKDHAKFSPVATAFYKLMPEIILKDEFYDEEAEKLQTCFSPGVIDVVEQMDGRKKAVVANARNDLTSRQIFMYEQFKDRVGINKIRNHFLCKFSESSMQTNAFNCKYFLFC